MGRHRVPPLHLVGVSLLTAAVFAVCHKLVVCTLGGSKIGDFFPPHPHHCGGGEGGEEVSNFATNLSTQPLLQLP